MKEELQKLETDKSMSVWVRVSSTAYQELKEDSTLHFQSCVSLRQKNV